MTRARRPEDWARDLASARDVESMVASALRATPLVSGLEDHTADFDHLDFFSWKGGRVWLDVKEKRQRYSPGIGALWPERRAEDLFVIDETVLRRIVWQGGGGYLAVHDVPTKRWSFFGPWELTLGPRRRYNRWIEKASGNRLQRGPSRGLPVAVYHWRTANRGCSVRGRAGITTATIPVPGGIPSATSSDALNASIYRVIYSRSEESV